MNASGGGDGGTPSMAQLKQQRAARLGEDEAASPQPAMSPLSSTRSTKPKPIAARKRTIQPFRLKSEM
jgi:hypothetical protein